MRKRNLCVLSVIWVISFVIVFCVKAEAQETLHLGASVPFSLRNGIELKKILEMNADLLNKSGGLTVGGKTYMIKYHIYDDKYDADAGRAAHERLVFEDKIKFDVGTFGSHVILASLGITEPNKIPVFSGAGSEKLLAPDIKYFVHTESAKLAIALARTLHDVRPDIKNVFLCAYDNEVGHTNINMLEKAYKAFGITPFPSMYFKAGESDFSRIGTKVASLKPDYFIVGGLMGESENIQMMKGLRDAGYKGCLESVYITQPMVDTIVAKAGKEAADGIYCSILDRTSPVIKNTPPGAMEFRKNYEKYYGNWNTDGLTWMDCWYTWLAAVKKADSIDPDKVMAVIKNKGIEVPSPNGLGKFFTRPDLGNNTYCDYIRTMFLGVVKGGKITFLAEKDPDYGIEATEKVYGVKMRK